MDITNGIKVVRVGEISDPCEGLFGLVKAP